LYKNKHDIVKRYTVSQGENQSRLIIREKGTISILAIQN